MDFSSPKQRRSGSGGGNWLLAISLILIGLVGYALLENQVKGWFGNEQESTSNT